MVTLTSCTAAPSVSAGLQAPVPSKRNHGSGEPSACTVRQSLWRNQGRCSVASPAGIWLNSLPRCVTATIAGKDASDTAVMLVTVACLKSMMSKDALMAEKICAVCGRPFSAGAHTKNWQKFCSDKCSARATRARYFMKTRGLETFEEALELEAHTPLAKFSSCGLGATSPQSPPRLTRKCHCCGKPCLGYRCDTCRHSADSDNYLDYY